MTGDRQNNIFYLNKQTVKATSKTAATFCPYRSQSEVSVVLISPPHAQPLIQLAALQLKRIQIPQDQTDTWRDGLET